MKEKIEQNKGMMGYVYDAVLAGCVCHPEYESALNKIMCECVVECECETERANN